jgi:D-serine deaminase-like pyridoxal phosphate-dependent protein
MTTDGGTPLPLGLTGVRSLTLSAEHTTIELEEPTERPWIGDQLVFAVGYGDTTVNLHDELVAVRDGVVTAIWPVAARGRIH